jgi:hypothetical protein
MDKLVKQLIEKFRKGRKVNKFLVATAALVALIAGPAGPANAVSISSNSFSKSPTQEAVYFLGACNSNTELDCIASFGVLEQIDGQEVFTPGVQTSYDASERSEDTNGNQVLGSNSVWQVNSAQGVINYSLMATLESPRHFWSRSLNGRAGAFRVFVDGDNLTAKVQLQIRTSWLKPLNLAMYASDADWSQRKIAGGNLWTFSGVSTKTSTYFGDWSKKLKEKAPADADGIALVFLIDHAGKPGESYYDPACSDKGFTAEASNASAAGQPSWNPQTRSLEFNISAPHTDTKGNLNKGFFKLWVSSSYMKCKWPESGLEKAPSFTVNVYNEDGTKQTATKVVSFRKGQLFVAAYNFHYSAPTVRIKAAKASKKSRITCVSRSDSSLIKQLKGKRAKCPKGFKLPG